MEAEVFRLLPCWLASPETVSALFPLKQSFDLVIFDEASQCPVERGLPAMLRGKQVVVAGDSRQLRPSDFYQIKWESDGEGMEYEAESLLELAGHFFEKHQLKGHYRSEDPALIHFSNAHFYGSQLETLPDFQTVKAGKSPFSWEKTEGIWENQMNKTEADAVVDRVKTILENNPSDFIGIVTGNYFQMELIREKLWKSGVQSDKIKVRNIENVQGDEFDQVILSLGYASNREGKLITNFGLLGKSGAENRLNVAITRARKMMHVISSIEPEDFRPGQLSNPGLALLREFLSFVKVQAKYRNIPAPEVAVDGFEIDWSLKNRLLEENSHYSRQIPSAVMDLIWTDGEGSERAILTDDQRFFNAPTAKAAIAYHPILLEAKGWKWEWKWSRFWKAEV
jgi:superfamily I DNA and/or RNA helicase